MLRPMTLALLIVCFLGRSAAAGTVRLGSICHVKGQESNTLQGLGLVVGLNGTGDGGRFLPAIRSLAQAMQLMGNPIGEGGAAELKDARNIAIVLVTATIPPEGAREGSRIDCQVSSFGAAKSLAGGRLFLTPLLGPSIESDQVYAICEGAVHLDDSALATTGRVHGGCRLLEEFHHPFIDEDRVTLVLKPQYASFTLAQDTADVINSQLSFQSGNQAMAQARDQVNVVVQVPEQYRDEPVLFLAQLLSLPIAEPEPEARVVINERAGSIVIGADVQIGSVVVTHKNLVIRTGDNLPENRFVEVDPADLERTQLQALVEALNAIQVPTEDIIEIIKGLERNGDLHARLIVE